jgi:hypothetical protein
MKYSVKAQELGYDEFDAMDCLNDMEFVVQAKTLPEARVKAARMASETSSEKRRKQKNQNQFTTQVVSITDPKGTVHEINKKWKLGLNGLE